MRTAGQIRALVKEAKSAGAFIVHTLVTDRLREDLFKTARLQNVDTIDLMGPLLDQLSDQLASSPKEEPGLFRQLNESYFRRIETMQFAFNHDDGKRPEELGKSEIILIGVSRTFKTPLSIYLAFKRWFVANVPIVLGIPIPQQLYDIPPERIFCLFTYPNRLAQLRRSRQEKLGGVASEYSNPEYVRKECLYASQVFASCPEWQKINVTSKSIEEISSEIVALMPKRRGEDRDAEIGSELT